MVWAVGDVAMGLPRGAKGRSGLSFRSTSTSAGYLTLARTPPRDL